MHIIQTRGLTRVYGGRRVVDGFDMNVCEGDIYGFVGKNGAGKSTVMKMIDGLVEPTSGSISLFGATSVALIPWGRSARRSSPRA